MVSSHTKASLPSTVPQTHSVGYGEIRGPQKLCHSFTFLSSELKKNKNKKKNQHSCTTHIQEGSNSATGVRTRQEKKQEK